MISKQRRAEPAANPPSEAPVVAATAVRQARPPRRKPTKGVVRRPPDEVAKSEYISPLLTPIPPQLVETFHYLVTKMLLDENLPRRIAVVAASHSEGVTTVARAFAAVLANDLNRSICLVDVDPRYNPRPLESGEAQPGLFHVLAYDLPVDAALTPTPDSRLHVLRAGSSHPGETREMLRSPRLSEALDELEAKFDHIIVDVPPILAGSKSLALLRHIPSYMLVVRHGVTKVDQVKSAVNQLSSHTSLGVVLNEFSSSIPKSFRRFFTV